MLLLFGGSSEVTLARFFCYDLGRATFDNNVKPTEKEGNEEAADGGVEDRIAEIFPRKKAHGEGENEADKASDEREVLHLRRSYRWKTVNSQQFLRQKLPGGRRDGNCWFFAGFVCFFREFCGERIKEREKSAEF